MKIIMLVLIVALLSVGSATATYFICDDFAIEQFSYCVGARLFSDQWDWFDCHRYDYNIDGVINLSDVAYFAHYCYSQTPYLEKKAGYFE